MTGSVLCLSVSFDFPFESLGLNLRLTTLSVDRMPSSRPVANEALKQTSTSVSLNLREQTLAETLTAILAFGKQPHDMIITAPSTPPGPHNVHLPRAGSEISRRIPNRSRVCGTFFVCSTNLDQCALSSSPILRILSQLARFPSSEDRSNLITLHAHQIEEAYLAHDSRLHSTLRQGLAPLRLLLLQFDRC
jgi:hypothetical protein